MAMIKCKMCGGELRLIEGSTVCECEYCGTKQTVPSMDNEKKLTLFSWAGRLLRGCEFDKAAGVFETIVADFPEEAEAYWGLVLCKYGIEYVDDPATGKKIPTCHRSSFESVLDDPNYEQACENTDALARRVYRDEARQIEELRQAILQVSGKEEPYEVFISYKETDEKGERTLDSVIAQDIYTELTERGHRTFFSRISLEDKLGTEYEPYIFAALNSAKVMLVVGTDFENYDSVWVKNEWSRFLKLIAAGQKKTLIPVFKNMDAYDMPKEFQKLSAQDMGKVGAMQDLLRGVEKIIGKKQDKPAPTQPASPVYVSNEADARTTAAVKRGNLALEDGEYDKAKEYFDQALNLDAECAEAYYGMGLAEKKCRSGEEYIHRLCQGKRDRQRVNLRQDKDRIEAAVKNYCIPGYLEEDTIRQLYQDTGYYFRVSESTKALAEQSKREFERNRNFSRAIRFADAGKAPSVLSFRDQVYASLRKLTTEAEKEDAANRQEAQNNYAAYLDKADEAAKAVFEEAQAIREEDYQDICCMQEQAKTEEDFRQIIDAIEKYKLRTYKDCEERIEQCRAECRVAAEKAEKERLLQKQAEQQRHQIALEQEKKRKEAEAAAAALARKAEKKEKRKKRIKSFFLCLLVLIALFVFWFVKEIVIPAGRINAAVSLLEQGQISEGIAGIKADESSFVDANKDRVYTLAEKLLEEGDTVHAAMLFGILEDYDDARERSWALWDTVAVREPIAAGQNHTVGMKSDGAVLGAGAGYLGVSEVSGWTSIVAVSASSYHTVGLRSDGTVLAAGINGNGQCDVSGWTGIVAVSAGNGHTVGLRSDGTVLAAGANDNGQCDVSGWTDIVAVSAGDSHTVGLRSDGTVLAVGANGNGQCDVSGWTDIVAISAGSGYTVGLRSDGTVLAVGADFDGQCNVSSWTDIVAISAGSGYTIGLKSDGTVVATEYTGKYDLGQCDVSDWTDIRVPEK